jgi:UDP-N-acetylmuramoyl-tripeptide--D-alanyl-D-alanine ligase
MFKISEIIKATQAQLIGGGADLEFSALSLDTRQIKKGEVFLAIKGERFDGHNFLKEAEEKGAVGLIVEKIPNQPFRIPILKVKDTVKALGEIARYQRNKFSIPLIAITGSNGKTTTKEILAYLLGLRYKVLKNEGTQNNQIGLPLTLLKLNSDYDIVVVELGTNHFGEIEYLTKICSPNIGILLNIGPAHLEFFKTLEGVFEEKISLIKSLSYPAIGILNNDDPFLRNFLRKTKNKFLIGFGIKNKCDFQAKELRLEKQKISFFINQKNFSLNTLGFFNVYNALASLAVCRLFGFSYEELKVGLKRFNFPPQRLEIKKIKGITFIDDTYNANPASLDGALNVLERLKARKRKIAILGDMLELGEEAEEFHYNLGMHILKLCDIIIGVGKFFGRLDEIAKKNYLKKTVLTCTTSEEARDLLFKKVKPKRGDIVLVKGSRLMRMEEVLK